MPDKKLLFVSRKNELAYFHQIISQRGLHLESRVILIQGQDGIGKTSLAANCLNLAKKARWQTVTVDWAGVTPHTASELLSILTDVLWQVIGDQQVKFLDEVVTRIEGIQNTVNQFQEDHPEIWQTMLASASSDESETEPILYTDSDKSHGEPRQRLINYMDQQKVFSKKLDTQVLYEPACKLAQALSDSIVKGAGRRGLIIWFDGCESLPPQVENFLRNNLVCPTVRKNAKLHFIISGSREQFREHAIRDDVGTLYHVKGYGDMLYTPPPLVWNLQRMVDPEVQEFLKFRNLDSEVPAVKMVQDISNGIPIFIELIADEVQKLGSEQVQAIYAGDNHDKDIPSFMHEIVQRFVESYPDPLEVQILYGLSLLLTPNDAALASVCSLSEDDIPGPIIEKISQTYAFVRSDGYLHDVMRRYLRDYLRNVIPEYAQFLGHNAAIHFQTLIKNLSAQSVEEHLNNQRWQAAQLSLINALCWSDEGRAIKLLAATVLEGVLFKPEFANKLLDMTSEFQHTPSFWSEETCNIWDHLYKITHADSKVRLLSLEFLIENETLLNLSEIHLAILHLLTAQLSVLAGKPETVIELCNSINEHKVRESGIHRILASTYTDAGVSLGFNFGEVVASENALHAFRRAEELGSESTAVHYGLGCVLAAFSQMDEAATAFSKVLAINPKHANTIYRRGLANYSLENYTAAVDDFTRSLNLYPGHAKAAFYRGMSYTYMGDRHRALADFSKAISIEPDMVQAYAQRGELYLGMGQLEKAVQDFTNTLERAPEMTEILAKRGETYLKLGHPEVAVRDLTKALTQTPDSLPLLTQRGSAYASIGQFEEAIEDFTQVLEEDPTLVHVFMQRGDCYTALDEYENALEDYTNVLTLEPEYAPAYTKRGALLYQLGEPDKAMVDYTKALDLDPSQPKALIARGQLYISREQYEDALTDFEHALSIDPTITGIEAQLGQVYLHTGQYDKALANFRIATATHPGEAIIRYHQGLARYHLQQYEQAYDDFNEALMINPQVAEVYIYRAKTQVYLDKPEQALIDFSQAIAVDPDNAEAYHQRGTILIDFKEYDKALEDINRAIVLNPALADAYNKRGLCHANMGKTDEAMRDYGRSVELNPRDASVYNNRGNTYARLGEYEKALLDYTQAITRDPNIAETYYNRGNILTDMGQFDNAIADFTQALTLNPDIDQAYYNRGNLYAQLGQMDNALQDLDRVLANNPQDTAALNNRGNIHADTGNMELALADYARALELNPQLGEIYTNRGLAYADTGKLDEALADYAKALSIDGNDATAIYYSACAFGLLQDESQACAWLEQAILLNEDFRTLAGEDPDFDAVRSAECFQALMGDAE